MIDKPEFHQTLILVFFAFLGGLTRELNDLISNRINFKNFVIGIITALTTGAIFGQLLVGSHVPESMACGLSGLAGFMGPHILFILSKGLEKKLETLVSDKKKGE
jgi:fluoride ion exporter CrcB/FEX